MKRNINQILKIANYLNPEEKNLIKKAFQFAQEAHAGQKRLSGEPYIQHSLHTAYYLTQMKADASTLAAALLHDVCEVTDTKLSKVRQSFGSQIAQLVDGVTKLGKVRLKGQAAEGDDAPYIQNQIENLRKMFLAMAADLRVVLIRLVDRLHNMQTLYALPKEKARRIARETLEIYAPLAHRLGIGELKGQLEDLAFPWVLPKEYKWTKSLVGDKFLERDRYIKKVIKVLEKELKKAKIPAQIHGRAKHLFSLYKKLLKYNKDITKIYDLVAARIIVGTVEECYQVLGLIHAMWKPLPGRIKDYIAMPKPNGYRSLHTTVFCLEGKIAEIQIRTRQMHDEAEYGIAAHFYYSHKKTAKALPSHLSWVKELAERQREFGAGIDFIKTLKIDIFSDRIFVFTPKGDVKDLPEGATPVDFAYAIHSEVGDTCCGAKVNGKMVSIDSKLNSGDMVEIVTSKKASGPKRDWLKFVKTSLARSRIRRNLREKGDNKP